MAIIFDDQSNVKEMAYIEVKLRTTTAFAKRAVEEAYGQLEVDFRDERPAMLKFMATRLKEMQSPYYRPVLRYLRDRRDLKLDSFHICLAWDRDTWSDEVLDQFVERVEQFCMTIDVHFSPFSRRQLVCRVKG